MKMSHSSNSSSSKSSKKSKAANSSGSSSSGSEKKTRKRSCHHCQIAHASCDNQSPCNRCSRLGRAHLCYYTAPKKRGRKRKLSDEEMQMDNDAPVREILMTVLAEMREIKDVQSRLEEEMAVLLAERRAAEKQQQQQQLEDASSSSDANNQRSSTLGKRSRNHRDLATTKSSPRATSGDHRAVVKENERRNKRRIQIDDATSKPVQPRAADVRALRNELQALCQQEVVACAVLTFTPVEGTTTSTPTLSECNAAFQHLVGYTAGELRGLPYLSLLHPSSREDTHQELNAYFSATESSDLELAGALRLRNKLGAPCVLACRAALYYDQTGRAAACVVREEPHSEIAQSAKSGRFTLIAEHAPALARAAMPSSNMIFETNADAGSITPSALDIPASPFVSSTTANPVSPPLAALSVAPDDSAPELGSFQLASPSNSFALPFAHPFLGEYATA